MYLLKISDPIILAIIALVATFLTLLTQIIMAIIVNKSRKEQRDLSIKVDGRLSELLEVTKEKHELVGHEKGVADQKAEQKIEVVAPTPIELKIGKLEVELKPPIPPEKEQ